MPLKFFLSLLVLFGMSFSRAQSPMDIEALMNKLQKIQRITSSQKDLNSCEPPHYEICNFNSFCQDYAGKATQAYLQKSGGGEKVPNYQLLLLNSQLSRCAGVPEVKIAEDPLLYPREYFVPGKIRPENRKLYEERARNAEAILAEVKDSIVQELNSRKGNNKNKNAQLDNLIQRVKLVQLSTSKLDDPLELLGDGCEFPNAFYSPDTVSVHLCPQLLAMPNAGLMSILAHEVAHAIDPCIADQEVQSKRLFSTKVIPPVAFSENPLKESVLCLASSDAVHIKGKSRQEVKHDLEQELEYLKMMKADKSKVEAHKKALNNLSRTHENHMFCSAGVPSVHIQEVYSDWMATKVLAAKLKKISGAADRKEFAFQSQAIHLSLYCPQIAAAIVKEYGKINGKELHQICPSLAYPNKMADNFDSKKNDSLQHPDSKESHPATELRITNVFMTDPSFRESLSCESQGPASPKNCR